MFSTKASGTWHHSLFVSSHFTAEAPFATRVLNIAQAVLASTFLFLPPSAPILWTMSLRSFSVLPKSWQVLACARAGGASAAAAAPASARRARSATGRRYRERGMVWSSLRRVFPRRSLRIAAFPPQDCGGFGAAAPQKGKPASGGFAVRARPGLDRERDHVDHPALAVLDADDPVRPVGSRRQRPHHAVGDEAGGDVEILPRPGVLADPVEDEVESVRAVEEVNGHDSSGNRARTSRSMEAKRDNSLSRAGRPRNAAIRPPVLRPFHAIHRRGGLAGSVSV